MGLDVFWYTGLKRIADLDSDVDGARIYDNADFPGRCMLKEGVYEYEDGGFVYSAPYSAYSRWRNELARMAGYRATTDRESRFAYSDNVYFGGPFFELIYFSDCEGTISGTEAVRIYNDFVKFLPVANDWFAEDDKFRINYNKWLDAFERIDSEGAIVFA